jgi:uracil-DNA glycosylase family 4
MRYRSHVYEELIEEASKCEACDLMNFEKIFLNIHNGNLKADYFFVGEGASLGKNWDARPTPMANSVSGDNFDFYLRSVGLTRYDVFTTNAVLHTPMKPNGTGMKPTPRQFQNCSGFLTRLIELVNPIVVIALGSNALGALSLIEPHVFKINQLVGRIEPWYSRHITALFHPSPQTYTIRSKDQQIKDYWRIVSWKKSYCGIKRI